MILWHTCCHMLHHQQPASPTWSSHCSVFNNMVVMTMRMTLRRTRHTSKTMCWKTWSHDMNLLNESSVQNKAGSIFLQRLKKKKKNFNLFKTMCLKKWWLCILAGVFTDQLSDFFFFLILIFAQSYDQLSGDGQAREQQSWRHTWVRAR